MSKKFELEEAIEKLEKIVDEMDNAKIDKSFELYKEGQVVYNKAIKILNKYEQEIQKMQNIDVNNLDEKDINENNIHENIEL